MVFVQSHVESVFLIASHIVLIPSIIYTIIYRLLPEFAIITVLFFTSTLYHVCQAGFFCVIPQLEIHQKADHWIVYSVLIWMLLFFMQFRLDIRIMIFFFLQALLFPFLLFYMSFSWFGIVVVLCILVVVVLLFGITMREFPKVYILNFVILLFLLGTGFTFFVIAGEPGESKYPVSHTIWHVASMLGIYFLLDLRYGRSWFAVGTRNLFKPKQQTTDLPSTDSKSRIQSSSSSSFIDMNDLMESDRKQKYILIKGKYNNDDDEDNSDSESEDYESEEEIKQPKLIISTSKHITSLPIKAITATATATTTVKKKEKNPIELFEQNTVFELTPKIIERFNKLPVTNFELLHTSKKPTKKLKRVKDEQ